MCVRGRRCQCAPKPKKYILRLTAEDLESLNLLLERSIRNIESNSAWYPANEEVEDWHRVVETKLKHEYVDIRHRLHSAVLDESTEEDSDVFDEEF